MMTKGFTAGATSLIGPKLHVALNAIGGGVRRSIPAHPSPSATDRDNNNTVIVRIAATDLRAARRATADIRREAKRAGGQPPVVLVDLEVVIAADVRTAWTEASGVHLQTAPRSDGSSLKYVGTPPGLASLLRDIIAADVADGVTLLPRSAGTRDLIVDQALPALTQRGVDVELVHCAPSAAA